jgi:hypothetical protein
LEPKFTFPKAVFCERLVVDTFPLVMLPKLPEAALILISGAGNWPTPVKLITYGFSEPDVSLLGILILPVKVPAPEGLKVTTKVVVLNPETDEA